jgi:hypothetical protein
LRQLLGYDNCIKPQRLKINSLKSLQIFAAMRLLKVFPLTLPNLDHLA